MAGKNPDFDAAGFKAGIRQAMTMGLSPDTEAQPEFHFPSTLVYTGTEHESFPFDPTETVQNQQKAPVKVNCAVEYFDDSGQLTNFGITQATHIKILLLDDEYEQVKDADSVVIGGDTYIYRRTQPPSGLFDVGIYEMHFVARQET